MSRRRVSIIVAGLGAVLIVCTAMGIHRVDDWSFRFATIPPADEELRQWLAGQPGIEKPEVWREGDELHVRYRTRFWRKGEPFFRVPTPPLDEFGYKGFKEAKQKGSTGWGW